MDDLIEICESPERTFEVGRRLGADLKGGEVVLLHGGLGAGKTLLAKGILDALEYDAEEVTSPSFTLVNLYRTAAFNVYHIDLWRLPPGNGAADAVGLDDIQEDESAVILVEWAEKLGEIALNRPVVEVEISGDGDSSREIRVSRTPEIADDGYHSKKESPLVGSL